jgi:hypothetical protein
LTDEDDSQNYSVDFKGAFSLSPEKFFGQPVTTVAACSQIILLCRLVLLFPLLHFWDFYVSKKML